MEQMFIYLGGALVGLLLVGWYWRTVHEIDKRNRYMEAQIKLLGKIAEKSGVTKDEIEGIYNTAANK
jgi:chromosome segregation and condensation protein ScpB